ncbi:MAG: UDP-N-acetylglucosamine 1-carboxyvinyltransferase [Bacteroidia bacterium]|nr:UDP-N-acetylglucosamine 1-carboxyvinyltransferase [Bacteroidia bacterium]MDW8158027.1 UDP-N-acetylglucosamine 1-carboxyvinyltransferase [Bacteroidia bacterium]
MKGPYLEVKGGSELKGEIEPQGAKNEALQILAACLLTPEKVTVENLPDIQDVRLMLTLLQILGVKVEIINKHTIELEASDISPENLLAPEARKLAQQLRGSVLLIGPLLARCGKVILPKPGGDKIGRRRLDTHFLGLQKLGAQLEYQPREQLYILKAHNRLKGTYILLDEASVTGTANLIMASVLAEGQTTIYHAACEPYIQQLCKMLCQMGATIQGIGSNLLIIQGTSQLGGAIHRLLADVIEVGSFIGIAAVTHSTLRIKNADVLHLGNTLNAFQRLGIPMEIQNNDIIIFAREEYQIETYLDGGILTISDHPWPGVSPDLLSILLVTATQCKGNVLIHQKMFESRLFFVDKLIDMGAQILLCDPHRAVVIGSGSRQKLRAISMSSPDIRAGIALLIAALCAAGKSYIYNIEQIDRGYQAIDVRLRQLGAQIYRHENMSN